MGLSRLFYSRFVAILLKFWNTKWQAPQLLLAERNWKDSQNNMANNALQMQYNCCNLKNCFTFFFWFIANRFCFLVRAPPPLSFQVSHVDLIYIVSYWFITQHSGYPTNSFLYSSTCFRVCLAHQVKRVKMVMWAQW